MTDKAISPELAEKIDALLMEAVNEHWTKIAVIIAKTYDAYEAEESEPAEHLGHAIAERLYVLVDNGYLDCQGNMRRWRDADVRLIQK